MLQKEGLLRGLAPVKGLPVSPLPRPRSVHPISVLVPGLPIPPLSQSCLSQPLPQCQACRPLCPVGCSGHSSCQALLAPLFLIAVSPLLDTLPSGLKLHVLTDRKTRRERGCFRRKGTTEPAHRTGAWHYALGGGIARILSHPCGLTLNRAQLLCASHGQHNGQQSFLWQQRDKQVWHNDPSTWALPPTGGSWMECWARGLTLAQLQLLPASGE